MYRIKDRKFVGMRIRDRRRELCLSQEKLAEAIGITYQQLQRYESGRSYLNTDRLQAISLALDVPITYLFKETGEEKIEIMEKGLPYIFREEKEFVEYLRKIDNEEHKKGILIFLKLAASKKKNPKS